MLQYGAMYDSLDLDGTDGDNRQMFFNHLAKAYCAFLSGDDDLFAALEDELVATFGAFCVAVVLGYISIL